MTSAVPIRQLKKLLRKETAIAVQQLSDDAIREQSLGILRQLQTLDKCAQATGVSIFLSMGKEVCSDAMVDWVLESKKRVFIPKVLGKKPEDMIMPELLSKEEVDTMERTKWGIPELTDEQAKARKDGIEEGSIDLILAPGVAFTKEGLRLGHGGGYYDSFISRLQAKRKAQHLPPAYCVGLALEPQIVGDVPVDERDIPLDVVVTSSGVYLNPNRAAT